MNLLWSTSKSYYQKPECTSKEPFISGIRLWHLRNITWRVLGNKQWFAKVILKWATSRNTSTWRSHITCLRPLFSKYLVTVNKGAPEPFCSRSEQKIHQVQPVQATTYKAHCFLQLLQDFQEDFEMQGTLQQHLHMPCFKEGKTDNRCIYRKPVSTACSVIPVAPARETYKMDTEGQQINGSQLHMMQTKWVRD